jgi:hypothetical protein
VRVISSLLECVGMVYCCMHLVLLQALHSVELCSPISIGREED